jgi:hypothetical protein
MGNGKRRQLHEDSGRGRWRWRLRGMPYGGYSVCRGRFAGWLQDEYAVVEVPRLNVVFLGLFEGIQL